MYLQQVSDRSRRVIDAVRQVIVGKDAVLRQVLMGVLADGHILIQDNPGLAKTLIAHSFAEVLDIEFSRIQFTPDLLPGEITGGYIYNQREAQFEFRRGPLFANLLLGDEINRATPKTQSALLEAMQERQVTVEGARFPLDPPFIVIATQNPVEFEGTYPLPEAQLDRFIMRTSVGYPDPGSGTGDSAPPPGAQAGHGGPGAGGVARRAAGDAARAGGGARQRSDRQVQRGPGPRHPRGQPHRGGGLAARGVRTVQAGAGGGGAGRPRLRHTRRT